MAKYLISAVILGHGLIIGAQSFGNFISGSSPPNNPAWLLWWPTNLGQSWLLAALNLEGSVVDKVFGLLWLISGLCLVGAALGIQGYLVPYAAWQVMAISGAIISLLMLLFYLHPFFLIGILMDMLILAAIYLAKDMVLRIIGG